MESTTTPPDSPVSTDEFLLDAAIDHDALERILNEQETTVNKYGGRASTIASESDPDYDSVRSASDHETKKKKEWVRPGRLRTVGDVNMPAAHERSGGAGRLDTWSKDLVQQTADIPLVDFGPTFAYKPSSRPGTSGTLTPGEFSKRRSRSRSIDRLRQSSSSRLSGYFATPSPGETNRTSYFGGRTTPTAFEGLDQPGNRNSVAWTVADSPGSVSPERAMRMQTRQTLSAEDWVQHRAALAALPQAPAPSRGSLLPPLAHQRHVSTSAVPRRQSSKTPPPFIQRPKSTELLQMAVNRTPPSRPHSRGASIYLNNPGLVHSNQTPTLSAKEQMHVARATGTKLIDLAANSKNKGGQEFGLIAAVAAREQEKSNMKRGIRGAAVEQAIQSRYEQEYAREAMARQQAEHEAQQRYLQDQQNFQYQQMTFQRNMAAQQHRNSMYARSSSALGMQQGYDVAAQTQQFGQQYAGQYAQQQQGMMMPRQQGYRGSYYGPQGGQAQQQWQQQLPRR